MAGADKVQAQKTLHYLASYHLGNDTVTTGVLREVMLETGGEMMLAGYLWDIRYKRLGPGVYKVWIEQRVEA